MNGEDEARFCFGIDIGTSFSCIALCDLTEVPPYHLVEFKVGGQDGIVPSTVLYGDTGRVLGIGQEALDSFLSAPRSRRRSTRLTLVRDFKAKFAQSVMLANNETLECRDAYEAYLAALVGEMRGKVDVRAGRICITHPARKLSEDSIGPRIVALAGKVFGEGFEVEGLDEASAVVQFLDREEGFLSDKPRRILVIDSGGGTTDFAMATASYNFVGTRKPLQIEWTSRSDKGGRDIDEAFYLWGQRRAGARVKNPVQIVCDLRAIKEAKESFPWRPDGRGRLSIAVNGQSVLLSQAGALDLIQPIIDQMLQTVVAIKDGDDVDVVILAGGNSLLAPFRATVARLLKKGVKVIGVNAGDIKTAVAKGASLYVNRTNRQLRFRLAYGVAVVDEASGHTTTLWRQGALFPETGRSRLHYVSNRPTTRLRIQRAGQAPLLNDLRFRFESPVQEGTRIQARFEIDDNGYIRYSGKPFGKDDVSEQEMVRQFLFDTAG